MDRITHWQGKLSKVLLADPKKAGMLGVLMLILAVLVARTLVTGRRLPTAAGAAASGLRGKAAPAVVPAPAQRPVSASAALQRWAAAPVPPVSRNLFAVRTEYFPADGSRTSLGAASGDTFWDRLEKSLTLQADQRDKRQNLIANYKAQAAALKLQSTMLGPQPRAMVNGELLGEGSVVAGFRVLKIEARRMIVEREGIRLEIEMK